MIKVLLINHDVPSHVRHNAVSGRSGKHYGYSVFSQKHGKHVFEMTAEAYHKAALDIARNGSRPNQLWVPTFIEVPDGVDTTKIAPQTLKTLQTEGLTKPPQTAEELDRLVEDSEKKTGLQKARPEAMTLQGMTRQQLRHFLPAGGFYPVAMSKASMIEIILKSDVALA